MKIRRLAEGLSLGKKGPEVLLTGASKKAIFRKIKYLFMWSKMAMEENRQISMTWLFPLLVKWWEVLTQWLLTSRGWLSGKGILLIIIVNILTMPFVVLSMIAEKLDVRSIRADVEACVGAIDAMSDIIPAPFIVALRVAEDRRSNLHPGVDPIAIMRAIYARLMRGQIQGASTIEQQFVRVVTGRYERSLRRKVREQLVAVCISRRRAKEKISTAYLCLAFYGSGQVGISALKLTCGNNLESASLLSVLNMVARLRYPEPLNPTEGWRSKINDRVRYIAARLPDLV